MRWCPRALMVILSFGSCIYAKPIEEAEGLYGVNDNVTVIDGKSFNGTVFNSPYIWMVEFYSSWCGHCQEFAPIFKAFARDIAEWNSVYRLAVINCPDLPNREICSIMNVDGYPEMRIFPPFFSPGDEATFVTDNKVETLRNTSVNLIDKYIGKVKWTLPGISKPSFVPFSFQDVTVFHKVRDSGFYLALVVGDDPFDIGREVILDMSTCRNITVRKFDTSKIEMARLEKHTGIIFENLPIIIVMSKNGYAKEIKVDFKRRHFYTYKLQNLPGVGDPKAINKVHSPVQSNHRSSDVDWAKIDRGKVYMADIESALRYALTVEVASMRNLEGNNLDALEEFVGTLALLSGQTPVRDTTKKFLVRLTGWLAGRTEISRDTWLKRIREKEPSAYLPQIEQRWVGCAPSKPGLRGYPCSLWTLFHSLTVAAYVGDVEDVLAVPRAMEMYITTFFSCMECRKNFILEVGKNPYENRILTHKDAILWLWEIHNTVNKRLHGALSEDPNIPKVQYPPEDLCPGCRYPDGSWNRDSIVGFLIKRYNMAAVSEDYMDIKDSFHQISQQDMREDDVNNFEDLSDDAVRFEDQMVAGFDEKVGEEDEEGDQPNFPELDPYENGRKKNSMHMIDKLWNRRQTRRIDNTLEQWNSQTKMNSFDTSLCIVLWAISFGFVFVTFLYMKKRVNLKRWTS